MDIVYCLDIVIVTLSTEISANLNTSV